MSYYQIVGETALHCYGIMADAREFGAENGREVAEACVAHIVKVSESHGFDFVEFNKDVEVIVDDIIDGEYSTKITLH